MALAPILDSNLHPLRSVEYSSYAGVMYSAVRVFLLMQFPLCQVFVI
jgi:hypothetical protein